MPSAVHHKREETKSITNALKDKKRMSDGNFNRSLLPKGELSAGIKVGKAQMRTKAEQAFNAILASEELTNLSEEQKQTLLERFKQYLH